MKAITVKYLGPTNFKGSRLKAYDLDGHQVTIPYDYGLSDYDLYAKAAFALVNKMEWSTKGLKGGGTKEGMVFVFTETETRRNIWK